MQLKKLQEAGCACSVLVSDLEAYLDHEKCPWGALEVIALFAAAESISMAALIKGRSRYYAALLREFMNVIGLKEVEIHHSADYEFKEWALRWPGW